MTAPAGGDRFLFGVGSAAHQVEGNNVNSDWWELEHGEHHPAEPSGDAIDHYHRYPDDIRLIAALGFGAYRFSIEWARVEPEPGRFSRAALDHYRRMLASCHEAGLRPVVTLHHFSSPRWIADLGGWERPEVADRFGRYCDRVAAAVGDLFDIACTVNEVNMPALIELDGPMSGFPRARPPARPLPFPCCGPGASDVMMRGHRLAVEALKARRPGCRAGLTLHMHGFVADPGGEEASRAYRAAAEDRFLDQVRGDDFVGVQAYGNKYVGPGGPRTVDVDGRAACRDDDAGALGAAIRHAHAVAGVPVIVTENGYATADDEVRRRSVERALDGVRACLRDGVPVLGYFYWSAFDIYEWMVGFDAAYGLIRVDRATQRRIVGPAAVWLGETARSFGAQREPAWKTHRDTTPPAR